MLVNVHCHAFNPDDLPVRGFVHRLHLQNRTSNKDAQGLFARYQRFAPDRVQSWLAQPGAPVTPRS